MLAADVLALSPEEQAMLAGAHGPAVQRAMEMVVALARIYGARGLVEIKSAQVAGVSYANIGDSGLAFLSHWADEGAKVRAPALLNPAGMDLQAWREMGVPEDFAAKQLALVQVYARMGVKATCTCAPYLLPTNPLPALGDHLAWSESSAVVYANSVLGARTNREGGPGALAAAIVGRTGNYGLHLDDARQPSESWLVTAPLLSDADWGALGIAIGRASRGVPYIRLQGPAVASADASATADHLRLFGAAAAAAGSMSLFHMEGVTAEARAGQVRRPDTEQAIISALDEVYASLNSPIEHLDLVAIGCPHASLAQLEEVARFLGGRHVATPLWLMASRAILGQAQARGLAEVLAASGARLLADTCVVVAPLKLMGIRSVATNSAKAAFYLPGHQGAAVRFGPLERCLEAALRGSWR